MNATNEDYSFFLLYRTGTNSNKPKHLIELEFGWCCQIQSVKLNIVRNVHIMWSDFFQCEWSERKETIGRNTEILRLKGKNSAYMTKCSLKCNTFRFEPIKLLLRAYTCEQRCHQQTSTIGAFFQLNASNYSIFIAHRSSNRIGMQKSLAQSLMLQSSVSVCVTIYVIRHINSAKNW